MGWNPIVIDVGDVPTVDINDAEVAQQANRIETAAGKFSGLAQTLTQTWHGVASTYATGHTETVIRTMDPIIASATRAKGVYGELAWALGVFVDDVRACRDDSIRLRRDVRAFLAIHDVQVKALVPGTHEFNSNVALYRRAHTLGARIESIKDKCKATLDAIGVDANAYDPYDGTTQVTEQGLAWGSMVDVTAQDLDWPLFGNSGTPSGNQVDQGSLGDCWFMSSLAALADKDPGAIERMVHDNGDGTYVVTLFVDGAWQSIHVDGTMLLGSNGKPQFSGDGKFNNKALWPLLVEKAAIEAYGADYAALNVGVGGLSMELFTGNHATTDLIKAETFLDHDAVAKYSALSHDDNVIMTANSNLDLAASLKTPVVRGGDAEGNVDIYNRHVYQISSIAPNGDVTLVNPWNENRTDGGNDLDVFTISASEFSRHFMGISVGTIN